MTKTRIKNALRAAGLLTSETTIQGSNRDFTIGTRDERVARLAESMGVYTRENMRDYDGSRSWTCFGADFGCRVSQTTRDLIAANMD